MQHIPIDECKHGWLYRIDARNFSLGVYNEKDKGFIGVRYKFGETYLFTEYHWDTGEPFGTVHPKEQIEAVPEGIEISESLGSYDSKTGRPLIFDKPINHGGRGWVYADNDEPCPVVEGKDYQDCQSVSRSNKELFDWIKMKRDEHYRDEA